MGLLLLATLAAAPGPDSPPKPKKVREITVENAVVGLGLSGLAAQETLQKAGLQVHGFDVNPIVGGRIAPDARGGELVGDTHYHVLNALDEHNLGTVRREGYENRWIELDRKVYTPEELFKAIQDETPDAYNALRRDAAKIQNEGGSPETYDHLTKTQLAMDKESIQSYLKSIGAGRKSLLARFFGAALGSELGHPRNPNEILSALLLFEYFSFPDPRSRGKKVIEFNPDKIEQNWVEGGMYRLPEKMGENLIPENVSLGYKLVKKTGEKGNFTLYFEGKDEQLIVHSKQVILTIPPSSYKTVEGVNVPSPGPINYSKTTKFTLEFEKPFWRRNGHTGSVITDEDNLQIWQSQNLESLGDFSLSFFSGALIKDPSEQKRFVKRCLKTLQRLHPEVNVANLFITSSAEFAPWKNSYTTSYKPGDLTALQGKKKNTAPDGMKLAGEWYGEDPGYANAALGSGYDAAEAVIREKLLSEQEGCLLGAMQTAGGRRPPPVRTNSPPH